MGLGRVGRILRAIMTKIHCIYYDVREVPVNYYLRRQARCIEGAITTGYDDRNWSQEIVRGSQASQSSQNIELLVW